MKKIPGLKKSIIQLTVWCFFITMSIFYIIPTLASKKMNYTELWKRMRALEMGLCVDVPRAECRPSLGQQCQCD